MEKWLINITADSDQQKYFPKKETALEKFLSKHINTNWSSGQALGTKQKNFKLSTSPPPPPAFRAWVAFPAWAGGSFL